MPLSSPKRCVSYEFVYIFLRVEKITIEGDKITHSGKNTYVFALFPDSLQRGDSYGCHNEGYIYNSDRLFHYVK